MAKTNVAPTEAKPYDPYEMVDVMVPRNYKSDEKTMYVNVNDHNFLLPRGKVAHVPRYIAEVVEQSAAQDDATIDLIQRRSQDE